MAAPTYDDTTERFYDSLPAHFRKIDPATGHSLKKFLVAPGSILNDLIQTKDEIAYDPDGDPPDSLSTLVDPSLVPVEWMSWLAPLLGVSNIESLPSSERRQTLIDAELGHTRGNHESWVEAIAKYLIGDRYVRVEPYTITLGNLGAASMWDILVVTKASETLINLLARLWAEAATTSAWNDVNGKDGRPTYVPATGFFNGNALRFESLNFESVELFRNLCINPNYTGSGTWPSNQAMYQGTDDQAVSGSPSGTVWARKGWLAAGQNDPYILSIYAVGSGGSQTKITTVPGKSYTIVAHERPSHAGFEGNVRVFWMNAADSIIGTYNGPFTALVAGEWNRVQSTAVAPALAVKAWVAVDIRKISGNATPLTHYAHVTDSMFYEELGQGAVEYFDGNSPDTDVGTYSWEGTVNQSNSLRRRGPERFGQIGFSLGPTTRVAASPAVAYSVFVKAAVDEAVSHNATLRLSAYNSGGTLISNDDTAIVITSTPTQFARTWTTPANTAFLGFSIINAAGITNNSVGILVGEAGIRSGTNTTWVLETLDVERVLRSANVVPAGMIIYHETFSQSWNAVEADNPTWNVWDTHTWDQIEEGT